MTTFDFDPLEEDTRSAERKAKDEAIAASVERLAGLPARDKCPHHCACVAEMIQAAKARFDGDVRALRVRQDAFTKAFDELLFLYRDFDRSLRGRLKDNLKKLYEQMLELGTILGISRMAMDHLHKG